MNTTIGERIKSLRIENNLTQPQLAQAINVSKGLISLWENNINEPKASYIVRLSKFFKVSSDYILCLKDYEQ